MMRKNCDTCKHDEFGEKYCDDCVSAKGEPPSKWEAAKYYKPDTNGDRIRAMSDEELAKLIVKHKPVYSWCKGVRDIWMRPNVTKEQAWVLWLQQPVQE